MNIQSLSPHTHADGSKTFLQLHRETINILKQLQYLETCKMVPYSSLSNLWKP